MFFHPLTFLDRQPVTIVLICKISYLSDSQKATLRVHVMDRNKLFTDSLISDFDCYVGGHVGTSVQDTKWTSTGNCVGKYIPDKIKYVD